VWLDGRLPCRRVRRLFPMVYAQGWWVEHMCFSPYIVDISLSCAQNKSGAALKSRGEDITAGKVTFPLLKAIPLLPADEMQRLWETVRCAAQCARWVVEQSFCLSPRSPGAGCGGSCAVLSDVSPVA
jgi:hypothetical protein